MQRRPRPLSLIVALLVAGSFTPAYAVHDTAAERALEQADKPDPVLEPFGSCGGDGDTSGDVGLNRHKNRSDVPSQYLPVNFHTVLGLRWPTSVQGQNHFRNDWTTAEAAVVKRYEGVAIAVEGFLGWARPEGAEKTNCNATDPDSVDFHVWLLEATPPGTVSSKQLPNRSAAIVVEVTPRLRAQHSGWTAKALQDLARQKERVRINGWLMLDQDHPEQLRKTRGTLWEIHPITEIEVFRNGEWRPLRP